MTTPTVRIKQIIAIVEALDAKIENYRHDLRGFLHPDGTPTDPGLKLLEDMTSAEAARLKLMQEASQLDAMLKFTARTERQARRNANLRAAVSGVGRFIPRVSVSFKGDR